MQKGIRFDSARAAAFVCVDLLQSSAGASESEMVDKLTEIIWLAIGEASRQRARRFSCLECYKTIHFKDEQEGRRVKCPFCGKKQPAPGLEERN